MSSTPDLILVNGKFTTLDKSNPQADAVAIQDGRFTSVGTRDDIMKLAGAQTTVIDLNGRLGAACGCGSAFSILRRSSSGAL